MGLFYDLGKVRTVEAVLGHDKERRKWLYLLPNCGTARSLKNILFIMIQHKNFLELPGEVEM